MNKNLKRFWKIAITIVSIVSYFSIVGMMLTGIGEQYSKTTFPANYPIVGGNFVVDWVGLINGSAFILGWLPYTLIRANDKKLDMNSPSTIFSGVGLFALFIVLSLWTEGIWRDIVHSFFVSLAFGGLVGIFGRMLQQSSNSELGII